MKKRCVTLALRRVADLVGHDVLDRGGVNMGGFCTVFSGKSRAENLSGINFSVSLFVAPLPSRPSLLYHVLVPPSPIATAPPTVILPPLPSSPTGLYLPGPLLPLPAFPTGAAVASQATHVPSQPHLPRNVSPFLHSLETSAVPAPTLPSSNNPPPGLLFLLLELPSHASHNPGSTPPASSRHIQP